MGRRSDYRKHDDLVVWDVDRHVRSCIDLSTPQRRKLRKRLMRIARKRIDADARKREDNT